MSRTEAVVAAMVLSVLVVLAGCRAARGPAARPDCVVGTFTPEEVKPVTPRHTCARASRAIVVDGDLSEWEGIAQIVLDQPGQAHGT
ncbi:MAG TPA: hypothetical protein VMZ92_18810, partial [Planctomycetota bacterium]|nr:hypothetical protein [Planctomycetota bacterium]